MHVNTRARDAVFARMSDPLLSAPVSVPLSAPVAAPVTASAPTMFTYRLRSKSMIDPVLFEGPHDGWIVHAKRGDETWNGVRIWHTENRGGQMQSDWKFIQHNSITGHFVSAPLAHETFDWPIPPAEMFASAQPKDIWKHFPNTTYKFGTDDVFYSLTDGAVKTPSKSIEKVTACGFSFPIDILTQMVKDQKGLATFKRRDQHQKEVFDIVISLAGSQPSAMKLSGTNVDFKNCPLVIEYKDIFCDPFVFMPSTEKSPDEAAFRNSLATKVMQDVIEALRVPEKNNTVELVGLSTSQDRTPIEITTTGLAVLKLFTQTLEVYQQRKVTRMKLSFVNSPDLRQRFLLDYNILKQLMATEKPTSIIGANFEPTLAFHGIKEDTQNAVKKIIAGGFRYANTNRSMFGTGGSYVATQAAYSCSGFVEHTLGTSNFGNAVFVCLAIFGRTVDGNNKPGAQIDHRYQESFYGNPPLGPVYCVKDCHLLPVYLIQFD